MSFDRTEEEFSVTVKTCDDGMTIDLYAKGTKNTIVIREDGHGKHVSIDGLVLAHSWVSLPAELDSPFGCALSEVQGILEQAWATFMTDTKGKINIVAAVKKT